MLLNSDSVTGKALYYLEFLKVLLDWNVAEM